jgi:hypothetical protein
MYFCSTKCLQTKFRNKLLTFILLRHCPELFPFWTFLLKNEVPTQKLVRPLAGWDIRRRLAGYTLTRKTFLRWLLISGVLPYTGKAQSSAPEARQPAVRENCNEPVPYRTGGKCSEACASFACRHTRSLCVRC